MAEITVIGDLCCHIEVTPDVEIGRSRFGSSRIQMTIGGGAGNIAAQLATLGENRIALHSVVGSDDVGQIVTRWLTTMGIDCSGVFHRHGRTTVVVILLTPPANPTLLFDYDERLRLLEVQFEYGDYVVTSGFPGYTSLIQKAKKASPPSTFVVDYGFRPLVETNPEALISQMSQTIDCADVAITSSPESSRALDEIIRYLRNVCTANRVAIVTRAERGVGIVHHGEATWLKAQSVEKVNNPIGAGDCFLAGFVCAQSRGMGIMDAVSFAQKVAAAKIARSSGYPTIEQVS